MSNLTQRILVALVAIPLFVFASLQGGVLFFALVALIASLGLIEFYKLAEKKPASPQILIGLFFGLSVLSTFAAKRFPIIQFSSAELLMMVFVVFVPAILLAELFRKREHPMLNIATTVGGVCYVSLLLGTLVGIRELFLVHATPFFESVTPFKEPPEVVYQWGGRTILTLFVSIWLCDSLAYFAGKNFGKHKLFERVSPKKTWEGTIAGYIGAVSVFIVAQSYLPYMSVGDALTCGSIVGIFGQLGDLAESLLKRDAGVKDSSTLIPGHGGALDRFDSLILVSPLVYLYLRFVVLR